MVVGKPFDRMTLEELTAEHAVWNEIAEDEGSSEAERETARRHRDRCMSFMRSFI